MVAIKGIRAANDVLKDSHQTLTAVFVGATSGIGLATLKAFTRSIPRPHAIIVGRSHTRFADELENLKTINPDGEYIFFEADVALMRNIDLVRDEIQLHLTGTGKKVDLLYTSQGYINFSSRNNTAEGLDESWALRYYGRVRFTRNLLPLMSADGRAVTILAGGQEGKVFEDDFDLVRNWGIVTGAGHYAGLLTLSYDAFAEEHPEKGFVHVFPGLVKTGLLGRSAGGFMGWGLRWVAEPIVGLFASSGEEVGERMLFYGTDEAYAVGGRHWIGTVQSRRMHC